MREKVLVADGSTFMRIMLETALSNLGFNVVGTAKDGKDTLDKYLELKPDIVLIDISLKEQDGIEVTRRISEDSPSTVIIMLIDESMDLPDLIVDGVRAGASGYMRKPLSAEEIERSIKSALTRGNR